MTTTQTDLSQTIAVENMQIGHRYLHTIAGYENGWVVASVEHHRPAIQVHRNGEWVHPQLVTVTYNNGRSITEETGTDLWIECDEA